MGAPRPSLLPHAACCCQPHDVVDLPSSFFVFFHVPLSTALHTHTHMRMRMQLYNTSATADYNPSKFLDTSHIGKKELAAMRSLAMRVKHSKTAYVVVGYGWMRFILNDEDKVEEMHVNWRLTSLKVRVTCPFQCLPPFSSQRHHVRALLCRSCSRCRLMYYKAPTETWTSGAGLARYHNHHLLE